MQSGFLYRWKKRAIERKYKERKKDLNFWMVAMGKFHYLSKVQFSDPSTLSFYSTNSFTLIYLIGNLLLVRNLNNSSLKILFQLATSMTAETF